MIFRTEPKNIRNILIIGHRNIGDICCDVIVVAPLKKRFPEAKIYFLTSPISESLLEGYPGIEKVLVLDRKKKERTWGAGVLFNKGLWKYHFDMIVVLNRTMMHHFLYTRHIWNMRGACKKEFISKKMHPIDIYLKFLNAHQVPAPEAVFDFNFDKEQKFCDDFFKRKGIEKQDKLVGILPLAAWSHKNWPIEKWNQLAKNLKEEYNIKTMALGRVSPKPYSRHVQESLSPAILSAIDQTSLKEAAALLRRCHVFIGPDSSLLHIASCLKVESIGLYGPTPVDYVYPYFHKSSILMLPQREEWMLCQSDPYRCPCYKKNQPATCMEKIEVEIVLEAVLQKLKVPVSTLKVTE
jgi:ADP-heptose:LPS heptosyltransferase